MVRYGEHWQSQKSLPPYFVIKYTAMKVRVVDSTRILLTLNSLIENTCTLLIFFLVMCLFLVMWLSLVKDTGYWPLLFPNLNPNARCAK